ncbi:MAG: ABC transporter substrate-binding protein [Anaerolineae bacterium]|nr:ABC transporter substrate-binding protein [Anaerolineae bacterium]
MKSRLSFTLLAIVAILALLLSSCTQVTPAPTATSPALTPTSAPATLTLTATPALDAISQLDPTGQSILLWHASSQQSGEVLQALVEDFNNKNEWKIKVKAEFIGGNYNDVFKRLQAAIASGETPNVAVAYGNQAAVYDQADAVLNLDPYVNSTKYGLSEEDRKDIFASFVNSDRHPKLGNKLLGFPLNRSMELMYYNADVLKELGFAGPPQTWDEFLAVCKAAKEKKDLPCYAARPSASTFAGWVFSRGGEMIGQDGKQVLFGSQAGLDSLTFLKTLLDNGYAYQGSGNLWDQADFGIGKTVFTFSSSANLSSYRAAVEEGGKFNWSVSYFPRSTPQIVTVIHGPSLSVFRAKKREQQLASWLFIRWFTERDQTAKWAIAANSFPVRGSAAESPEFKAYAEKNREFQKAFEWVQYGKVEPQMAEWNAVRTIIQDAVAAVIQGADPKAALDKAVTDANTALTPR